ncbi:MAG: type II toxin-antitoxin system VapC family toxin [Saprospiraceae bacterium]
MTFLFDTNIIYHYLKQSEVMRRIETEHTPFHSENECWVCVVSLGEIRSMALANQWGSKRLEWIEAFLRQFVVVDLLSEEVLNAYAEVETYSQCRLLGIKSQPLSPRNMGKNDLWIAATAHVLDARLLTTDADFDHLQGVYLDLERVVV